MLALRGVRVLIDYRPALRQRTGVGEYAHRLAAALVSRLGPGAVLLFSSSWKDRLGHRVEGAVPVDRRIPVRLLNACWHRLNWPPVETLAGRLDVVHAMHPLIIPARDAAQVITIHDLYFLDHPEHTRAEIRRDYAALAPSHARRAHGVIAVSEYTAGQVRGRLGVPSERITICPPGAPAWPRRAGGRANGPILFVGTLERRKNVATLLEAYERLAHRRPGAPALILAGRQGADAAPLLDRLKTPGLSGRVRHVGYVSDEDRERLYRDASLLVLPSFDEGFGMPALEAMTVGVPVVAANRGAIPEVVGEAGVLVDPHDPEGLALAMERVLTDADLARTLSDRGVERAGRFSWEASAASLVDAYRGAMERRLAHRE